jgi:hypothetical protein
VQRNSLSIDDGVLALHFAATFPDDLKGVPDEVGSLCSGSSMSEQFVRFVKIP